MMTTDKTLFIWRENDEWWDVDEKTNKTYLTEKAPPEAVESFNRLNARLERNKNGKE